MNPKPAPARLGIQSLTEKIKNRHAEAKEKFQQRYPQVQRFFKDKGIDLGRIREHSTKLLTAGTLAGALLLSPPDEMKLSAPKLPVDWVEILARKSSVAPQEKQAFVVEQIKKILPQMVCPLNNDQERQIELLLEKLTGIRARVTLEGEYLNTCYGLIGAEQHLPRFPGDTVAYHDEFRQSGITPGRGAWGYFATSQKALRSDDILREKYYVAVQTLYLPDWEKRLPWLREWYKYRKVLVLNPQNGQAVVAVVADSGPAAWTGKQFGGSPEVMYELGYHKGPRKGPVLLFFVDDPENQVPLGPLDYNRGEISL